MRTVKRKIRSDSGSTMPTSTSRDSTWTTRDSRYADSDNSGELRAGGSRSPGAVVVRCEIPTDALERVPVRNVCRPATPVLISQSGIRYERTQNLAKIIG